MTTTKTKSIPEALLKRLSVAWAGQVNGDRDGGVYKQQIHRDTVRLLKFFAGTVMRLKPTLFHVSSNPAGPAMSGEVMLYIDATQATRHGFFVQISAGSVAPVMFRTTEPSTLTSGSNKRRWDRGSAMKHQNGWSDFDRIFGSVEAMNDFVCDTVVPLMRTPT